MADIEGKVAKTVHRLATSVRAWMKAALALGQTKAIMMCWKTTGREMDG